MPRKAGQTGSEGGDTIVTLRLPRDLHATLKKEAEGTGRTLAGEVRQRLEASFRLNADDPETTSLLAAIAGAARDIQANFAPVGRDAFAFAAFRVAIDKLLRSVQPKGNPVPKANPDGLADILFEEPMTPEKVGALAAYSAIKEMREP